MKVLYLKLANPPSVTRPIEKYGLSVGFVFLFLYIFISGQCGCQFKTAETPENMKPGLNFFFFFFECSIFLKKITVEITKKASIHE